MLTLEEAGWALSAFKFYSSLNILPIGVDVKSGRIQRQSSKIRVFMWKILFGMSISHWVFMFGRLVQSTILEPEKYFRWDHFILHFGVAFAAPVFYYTAFVLFVKNASENMMIFNHLFEEREDPNQKGIRRQLQLQFYACVVFAAGSKTRGKSGARIESTSAREPNEEARNRNQAILKQSKSGAKILLRPLLTWPPQYSLAELAAKLFPWAVVFTEVVLLLILAIDPNRPQLLYSALPPEWQNVWSFLILLAVETLWIAMMAFTAGFAIATQVLFFGKCQLEFKRLSLQLSSLQRKLKGHSLGTGTGNGGGNTEREIWILRQILGEMRELVVLIELFNSCFPFCIFAWKICALSICIMFYFFVIRHHANFPLLGVFLGYAATLITLVYTIMYGHAFSIPGKMDELKNEFLLTAQKATSNPKVNKIFKAEMQKEIRRIHGVGIKVGSFNQMERESTPNFVDFVLRNVVTLLVTFPR